MKEIKVNYPQGLFLPIGGQIFGGCVIVVALTILIKPFEFFNFCVGVAVSCMGLVFFSSKGLEINETTKRIWPYTKVLGMRIGKMVPLSNYKYITIINQGYSQSSFSRANVELKSSYTMCNLLLINDTHHLKLLVSSFDTLESAKEEAKRLSELIHYEIVDYNPVRSTRIRRR